MGQIWDIKTLFKCNETALKSARFVLFVANLTQFWTNPDIRALDSVFSNVLFIVISFSVCWSQLFIKGDT